jgi:HEAT repeat protein
MRLLALIALALAAATVVAVVALISRRLWLERRERRWRAATEKARPAVLALIDGDATAGEGLRGTSPRAFAALLGRYAVSVRGEARERITRWFEDHGAVDRELEHLRSRRGWHRAQAAFTLGDMGSARAVPALVAALEDRDRDVRAAATRSLGHLQASEAIEPAVHAAVERRVPRSVVGAAALELGPAVLAELTPLLEHERPQVRATAAELVGLLDVSGNAGPLVARLRDPAPAVRAAAAVALVRVADESATQALLAALGDEDPTVRAAAATALGAIGGEETLDALLRVARDDDFEPARAAAHAAARIDPGRVAAAADAADGSRFLAEAADLAAL